ncbi:hypothetical protein [Carboxylicivirga taeanensis]|uniref:hypothetical protein n=1 Tax=Carboxylicivirga taeanensis TaxID=1416875 RepID=UPI003F6DB972
MKRIRLTVISVFCLLQFTLAQTPVVYKEMSIDPLLCLQINNFEVAQSMDDLKQIPLKYNAKCDAIDFGRINFDKKSVVICSQYVKNGNDAIKTTRIEVLRNDQARRIDVYFASFGNGQLQRPGKMYENRRCLLLPKFPENYTVDVHYSLKVVEP